MKKGIIYSFIISLVICMIMPFSIYANTSGNQVGFTNNTSYSGTLKLFRYETQAIYPSTGGQYTYAYYFQADPGMYGVISGRMNDSTSEIFTVAVQNGISETFFSNQQSAYVYSVQLVEYNQTLPQEVIDYIANIDSNVELTADLLDQLILLKQFDVPYESYPMISWLYNANCPLINTIDINTLYKYPVFQLTANTNYLSRGTTNVEGKFNNKITMVFGTNLNISSDTTFLLNFNIPNGFEVIDLKSINVEYFASGNLYFYVSKITIQNKSAPGALFYLSPKSNCNILPIFYSYDPYYVSTDFALRYGLSNQLLDDLNIVAQGTQQSQTAAGDLEQGTSDLASDISSYNQIESDYNNQMNQALNNIDFSDQFSNNQNFMSGASFVKTVFNSFMQIDILRIFFIILCIVLIAKRFI